MLEGCSDRNRPIGQGVASRLIKSRHRRDGAGYDRPRTCGAVFAIAQIWVVRAAPPRARDNSALEFRNTQKDTAFSPI